MTSSASFACGVSATLANGRRVSARGTLSSGVLLASLVTFEDVTTTPPPSSTLKVEGTISGFVSLARRVAPAVPLYAGAAALLVSALGIWWWAERDAVL